MRQMDILSHSLLDPAVQPNGIDQTEPSPAQLRSRVEQNRPRVCLRLASLLYEKEGAWKNCPRGPTPLSSAPLAFSEDLVVGSCQ